MEGIERLETEALEMNDYNVMKIFQYLKTRKDLYEKFNNEEKHIEKMYNFICNKANKLSKNYVAMVDDKVVYLWAVNYFIKNNEELGIKDKQLMPPTSAEIIKKDDEKKDKKEETKLEDNQITLFQEVSK